MNESRKLTWVAPEYEQKEQSTDWFWALGIVVVAGSVASIIFENYFFALLLVIGGSLMVVFAKKKPDIVSYELNEKGLMIRSRLYPYETIKAFWVRKEGKPTLFFHSKRIFLPEISIPIEEDMAEEIRTTFLSHGILEEEMKEHATEKIMDLVGF